MVITNAIYFKGTWVTQFDKESTTDENFEKNNEDAIPIQMMNLELNQFNFDQTDDIQIIELPYVGENLSMLLILPNKDDITGNILFLGIDLS